MDKLDEKINSRSAPPAHPLRRRKERRVCERQWKDIQCCGWGYPTSCRLPYLRRYGYQHMNVRWTFYSLFCLRSWLLTDVLWGHHPRLLSLQTVWWWILQYSSWSLMKDVPMLTSCHAVKNDFSHPAAFHHSIRSIACACVRACVCVRVRVCVCACVRVRVFARTRLCFAYLWCFISLLWVCVRG